jgi:hypothetical protein
VVAWHDADGNKTLDPGELRDEAPWQLWAVTAAHRALSLTKLTFIQGVHETASNFMRAFTQEVGVAGATRTEVILQPTDQRLSHKVGANFGPSGRASIDKWTFSKDSSVAQLILQAIDLSTDVRTLLTNTDAFADIRKRSLECVVIPLGEGGQPSTRPVPSGSYSLTTGVSFHPAEDGVPIPVAAILDRKRFDLGAAFGRVASDLAIKGDIVLEGSTVVLTNINVRGRIWDLYDWDMGLGDELNSAAAAVQAGYGTMGKGGRIFELEVLIDGVLTEEINGQVVPKRIRVTNYPAILPPSLQQPPPTPSPGPPPSPPK